MHHVYDGINIRHYYDNDLLRYDYLIAAGADESQIQFHIDGADAYEINQHGELQIRTSI